MAQTDLQVSKYPNTKMWLHQNMHVHWTISRHDIGGFSINSACKFNMQVDDIST